MIPKCSVSSSNVDGVGVGGLEEALEGCTSRDQDGWPQSPS